MHKTCSIYYGDIGNKHDTIQGEHSDTQTGPLVIIIIIIIIILEI